MTDNRDAVSYAPTGKIDESNWQAFSDSLIDAVEQAAEKKQSLVVDLSGVPYMSSRGLRALTLEMRNGLLAPFTNPNCASPDESRVTSFRRIALRFGFECLCYSRGPLTRAARLLRPRMHA